MGRRVFSLMLDFLCAVASLLNRDDHDPTDLALPFEAD